MLLLMLIIFYYSFGCDSPVRRSHCGKVDSPDSAEDQQVGQTKLESEIVCLIKISLTKEGLISHKFSIIFKKIIDDI